VPTAQSESLALIGQEAELSERCYYRWRKEHGGLSIDPAKR
jgi:hypothetical protein